MRGVLYVLGGVGSLTVYLRCVTSSLYSDSDVYECESLYPQHQHGLQQLQPQQLRLEVFDGLSIDLNQPSTPLAVRDGHTRLLTTKHLHAVHHRRQQRRTTGGEGHHRGRSTPPKLRRGRWGAGTGRREVTKGWRVTAVKWATGSDGHR